MQINTRLVREAIKNWGTTLRLCVIVATVSIPVVAVALLR